MAWTELTRAQHNRKTGGYPSDLTDSEWAVVQPLLPGRNRLGRLRKVWNAIQYIAASGCAWSLLPRDFAPVSNLRYYFYRWRDNGLLAEINRALVAQARHAAGRNAQPTVGVIDSQSVKTSENTSLSGFDAGKRIKGRKRHIITDTCGNLLACTVHSAGIQDRDGAPGVFARLRREAPNLRHMFADGGYAGPKLRDALVSLGRWTLQIVKRSDTVKGFEVLPRRWVIERTFAWLAWPLLLSDKGLGKTVESAEAWLLIAHIRRLTSLIARA